MEYYNKCPAIARENPNNGLVHFLIYFAEKVLLLSLAKQIGRLYFLTGLKSDFFGVFCANSKTNHIFSLAEGHKTGCKTLNEVFSMLLYSM